MFVPSAQIGHNGHISDCGPPTSNDHIFRVQTPFRVFLDTMECPLSQDYFHVPVEGSGDHKYAENYVLYQVCRLLCCVDVNGRVLT